ncbi:MAG: DEAD/DEAH box helicase [Firmicutes bacterium]|jgi:DEAD/DEAH box helicase domain-containing protein|nr:DEAD/DEAH box helicase [Bacillota bacterium]
MEVEVFLRELLNNRDYRGQAAGVRCLPARDAFYSQPQRPLAPELAAALTEMGIRQLYSHQAKAVDLIREGHNVVIVTSTASGKTLCYNLPVLETLLEHPDSKALYLFPTKALAQDQLQGLNRWQSLVPSLPLAAGTYDGDTPRDLRRKLRDQGNVILTNPDMLHAAILPHHPNWGKFFADLRFVVLDEIHTYRGIFGSNVANVLRRLQRICRHYQANPQFICCSATIANPVELAKTLTGQEMALVDNDGSPKGKKHFVLWNPPLLSDGLQRRSANAEAKDLMVRLLRQRIQTITFTRARVVAELIYRYVREELSRFGSSLANSIRAYRGGYLPEERRAIERQLFSGELLGVSCTNALELGIDIGSLDACLIVGFPGTIASVWQQAGRAGRHNDDSLVVLIAHNNPIDQYLMQHPQYFFEQTPESAVVDPDNPYIVLGHLRAAAFELPVRVDEETNFGPLAPALLDILGEDRQVVYRGDRWFWTGRGYPADDVNLRNITENMYTIVDTTEQPRVIGSTDELSAFMQLHNEAVYIHEGDTYFVSELNLTERVAYVHRAELDYYTQSISDRQVQVQNVEAEKDQADGKVRFGEVTVTYITYMFKKIKFYSQDSIGFGKVSVPPSTLETCAFWLSPSLETLARARQFGRNPQDGLLGIANVLTAVLPLYAMCDSMDIGSVVDSSNTGVPTVFVFDRFPGGIGYANKGYELIGDILEACLQLIEECRCSYGCPSCVGSPLPPYAANDPDSDVKGSIPDKEAAILILHDLLGREPYVPKLGPPLAAAVMEAAAQAEVERPPSAPLPERVELRIRQQIQRLNSKR